MTHIPAGVVVRCQDERSQHENRALAWQVLAAKLQGLEEAERDAEPAKRHGDKGEIAEFLRRSGTGMKRAEA